LSNRTAATQFLETAFRIKPKRWLVSNNQANCIGLRTFPLRKRFAVALALVLQMVSIKWNSSLLGKASHRNLVDDKWQMRYSLSPNHPAQVFKT
jgi:hypothetical protein